MNNPTELITLDFHEHDTRQALEYLLNLVAENRVSGMVYAVMLKRGEKPLFGATGRLASNDFEAAGLAATLEDQLTQPYLACSCSARHHGC